ncbi:unnamed protein product [Notodromas monacha]|uniref:Anion exchange protein n=1 Tax=Notodromas monacha TaxID=399045 RepID=A0A7R9GDX2_9CRUS|nr:unnamed protein product [Notodromas monacha]CAG0917417.1 unnamed protein product [Notodromas monacha]
MKKGLVKFGDQEHVKESFLHPPSHQRGQGGWIIRSLAEIGRTYTAKKAEFFQSKECSVASMSMAGGDQAPPTAESTQSPNTNMMRKLPPNVEATNIMVGEMNCLDQPTVAFIRLKNPINLGDLTEVPVATRFLFVLLGPKERQNASKYRQVGRSMATLLTDEVFRVVAYNAATSDHLISGVDEFLGAVTVLPPGGWDPTIRIEPPGKNPDGEHNHPEKSDATLSERALAQKLREEAGLVKSGRLFGGLINDIKRKAPWYFSDFKDGFAMQCVATWFFMYFACLTPIVTFGGMLGDATGHSMSAMESIVSGAIVGVSYALFSGQPLTILGSTGPVLVFDTIIYSFCQRQEWDFLAFRFWIGMWVALMLLIIVAMDWSYTVSFITRFTEENFACLIAFIFIFESFKKVYGISKKYPINMSTEAPNYLCHCNSTNTTFREMLEETDPYDGRWGLAPKGLCEEDYEGELFGPGCFTTKYYPDVFFLSVILFAGTYIIAASLKSMPATPFFPSKVRTFLSDFAVIISITLMTLLDMLFGISTPKLMVPSEFAPTMAGRGWIIDPFRGNDAWWSTIAAAVPAMLCVILVFMDQQITAVIVNRKENKLKKGCGYHLDLLVLALLIAVCSVMGIPWFIAATVRSMNHVNSLRLESECSAPGEKPQFLGIREQRITSLLIGLTIGISVFLTPILGLVPMPVLYGVFLYMGLSSLNGIQVFQRILIMFMPAKYQPDRPFLRKVSMTRVHMFTCVQLACFALLWTVKSFEQTSILFPIMLIVMIAVRKILDKVFTRHELTVLDDLLPEFRRESMNENQC